MSEWRFPSNDYGEKKGINDSGIATFRGTPLRSLAREICQNSLDAARAQTVRIEFNAFDIAPDGALPQKPTKIYVVRGSIDQFQFKPIWKELLIIEKR